VWIFARKGFLSIVQHQDHPELLLVRARFRGDIEAIFPGVGAEETEVADYHYRVNVPKVRCADVIAKQVLDIDYENFKASLVDQERHDTYLSVWGVMVRAQDRLVLQTQGYPDRYSLDFDEEEGEVDWGDDLGGPFFISPKGER
jgi:hypothetical protein